MSQSSVRTSIVKTNQNVSLAAYRGTNQSGLTGNAWNKITLDTVIYDLGANFDTTNHKFIAPVTGLYHLRGSVHFTSTVTAKRYLAALYKNGTAIKYAYQHTGLVADLSVAVEIDVFLVQNDYIELYAQPEVGGGVNTVAVVGGNLYTSLIARLISKEGIRQ